MFKMYLKTALRNLVRNKFYSIINIIGLSIGIAVFIMIFSFVWLERSFDRFHSKADQIYRIIQTKRVFEKEEIVGATGFGLVPALKEEFPEILNAGRLFYANSKVEMSTDTGEFVRNMNELIKADPAIFDIFDFQFIHGNPETVFQDPNSIIFTEEESKLFFGNDNPIGKFITIRNQWDIAGDYNIKLKVTGVVKSMPKNSHFHFKHLMAHETFPWKLHDDFVYGWYTSYILLPKGFNPKELTIKFPDFVKKYYASEIEEWVKMTYDEWLETGGYWKLKLQPLKQIHLGKYSFWEPRYIIENQGNLLRVQIYTTIALFIIFIACINFITLSLARSGTRAIEVGVRKVNGATRKQLIFQFLTESVLISFIAFFFAILLIKYFAASFNKLLEIKNTYDYTDFSFISIALFVFMLILGVLTGSYPAFFLSAFRPVQVLKGQFLDKMKGMKIKNGLVVFQFIISMVLIISSVIVYKQFIYMQHKDLGFEKENIIIIKDIYQSMRGYSKNTTNAEIELRFATFRQEILKFSSVSNVSYSMGMPGKSRPDGGYSNITIRLKGANSEISHVLNFGQFDNAYFDIFGLEMAAGKNFGKAPAHINIIEGVILNKAAVNLLGLKDPVGKYIYTDIGEFIFKDDENDLFVTKERLLPIIGVFKDFHNRPLYEDIKPTIYLPAYTNNMLVIKFLQGQTPENLDFLEETWNRLTKEPLEYFFFDKEFEDMYIKEKKLAQAFTFFTILAIFIACLGIFGLAILATEQRTKEIGIRKVNGATVKEILFMLNKDFIKWVGIAFVIACPIAYYAMSKWLENFAFKTTLNWWVFALAGLFTLIIALLTVSWQSYRAATRNPVEALRDE